MEYSRKQKTGISIPSRIGAVPRRCDGIRRPITKGRSWMSRKTIGERIRAARKQRKLTQEALAQLCGWESQTRVSHYEVGRRTPDIVDIETLAAAMQVSPVELLYGNESGESTAPFWLERVPLIGTTNHLDNRKERMKNESKYYLDAPSRDSSAFALRVAGSELAPRMRAGEAILVEPSISIEAGDEVLVIMKDGSLRIREFIRKTATELTLDEIVGERNREVVARNDVESVAVISGVFRASMIRTE